ncbi:hypothetical protein Adeg_1899 [Ammonifex degensii KC4]|uniref:Cytoplasmic chaperone TorD family protein n=2 Tax=Ammonifex degensii TaxID=42838 RepID=C9R9K0_AMMDK|nr:hypothetical protein Adeg_1899 [Ammonifex degensii KC4]
MGLKEQKRVLHLSMAFKLAALGFSYPTPVLQELVRTRALLEIFTMAIQDRDPAVAEMAREWATATRIWERPLDEIQALYTAIFDVGYPEPPCPPYAGIYLPGGLAFPGPRPQLLAELMDRYRRWGLDLTHELPDHIGVELEFMHFLLTRWLEGLDRDDRTLVCDVRQEGDWFVAHLQEWLPAFRARLARGQDTAFWVFLVDMVQLLITRKLL